MQTQQLQQPCSRARQLPPPKQPPDPVAALDFGTPSACSGTATTIARLEVITYVTVAKPACFAAYAAVPP